MKFCRAIALFLLSLWSVSVAWADTPSQQLSDLLENLHTMQATFTQTINDHRGNILQQSQGTMALQRPGKFRWETTQPNQQLIVANPQMIWIYDKDLQQITKQKPSMAQDSPGLLLSDSVTHLATRFYITQLNTNTKSDVAFALQPINKNNALFQTVDLYFSASGDLEKMTLRDNLGQETHITFTQVKINQSLSPRLFQFYPPAHVPVVTGAT